MGTKNTQKIEITQYTDYAHYIKDLVENKKKSEAYSLRLFCKKSGFKSPSYLKWVMDGTRGISLKSIHKFIDGLELDPREAHYFQLMVNYKEAKDERAKHYFYEEMLQLQKKKHAKQDLYEYLSHWYYVAIRELTAHPEFKEDPQWIQNNLCGDLGLVEIKQALKTMEQLKLLIRNEEGRLIPHNNILHTGQDVQSHAAFNYHTEVLDLSKDILVKTKQSERNFSSLLSNMDEKSFATINEMAKEFQNKVVSYLTTTEVLARHEKETNQNLYMLNMYLLPFSNIKNNKGEK
ncbi:TIGR02147 family protein [bacterium]|nr:TIGR02147 family protein [bacterium]